MKLRVLSVVVQPVLVWDDGDELSPGPEVNPVSLKLSELRDFEDSLDDELVRIARERDSGDADG